MLVVCVSIVAAWVATASAQQAPRPIVDPNVNMVRGITFPDGDPYLQRQNEPSIAVSTRNPCHLLAGANDYRSVDVPFDDTQPPNSENNVSLAGDAWMGLFKSVDCGAKWTSTLMPGYPQDNSGVAMELKGHEAGADPTVRAGTNGLFYYSGMVFNRGSQGASKIFVARIVDNNNKERGDPFEFLDVATIDSGTKGQFLDKPWLAVDVPRNGFGPGSTLAAGNASSSGSCVVNGQQVAAGHVYMAWARFTGDKNSTSKLMFARSQDCGRTWQANPISNNQQISQGANIAIAPHDGTIYLTWREFARTTGGGSTPVSFWFAMSSDGGKTFTSPRKIADNVTTFDQLRSNTTFRSNALPAIVADHQERVYIAWSARGYATTCTTPSGAVRTNTDEARITMMVSGDRGRTFGPLFPIDPSPTCGHQMMPSLSFAAGKVQAIWYDAREDASGVFGRYVDDRDVSLLRHTVDVRGAQAEPATSPVFTSAGSASLEISRYREWQVGPPDNRQSVEIGSNPPNLPMYAQGTTPFMGDYIDLSALAAFPIQSSSGQVWQPNIGTVNMMGPGANNLSTQGFPTLPIFHAAWTDNRDVRIAAQCVADPSTGVVIPQQFGQRNANIYTSRLTPGFFVGSPGNTKPLGFRNDPETGQQTTELIQRGFVVFAQNTTDTLKFFQFSIANQPAGGRASFRQFDPAGAAPQIVSTVAIPRRSTVARTVYATSTDPAAQILVNVQEVSAVRDPGEPPSPGDPGTPGGTHWTPLAGGLRSSILLNPDRTNPRIVDPDELDPEVPQIATNEVHDPSMFEAQFFRYPRGTVSSRLDVRNPDPENPDPENPDPENPDPENPDPENPDPENPDPENPDPENPDPENPDPENPDPENPDVENTAISAAELANAAITDVNWRVHNNGNTTSAYRFRPSLPREFQNQKYQLIVTRRYMVLSMDPVTCQPIYKSHNQVLVNIQNFRPKTPDPENPDPENPDPENPDPENPDPENPDPENPDPENPDPENANFFLAPEETATVTLRVFDLDPDDNEPAPTTENDVAGKTAAQAANTGETEVSTAVAGPDLTLDDVPPTIAPAVIRPGSTVSVTWTLTNRGTASAIVPAPNTAIRTNVYFSADAGLDPGDLPIGPAILEPTPFVHCTPSTPIEACSTATTTVLNLAALPPQYQAPGLYYLIVVTDDDNDADDPAGEVADPDRLVFEADELNNVLLVPISVDAYQLMFVQQPSTTTQDFAMAPVSVAITHPDGGVVPPSAVPFVTLSIQSNPAVPPGILSGTFAQPNVNGAATFGDLRIDRAAVGYTLAASAPISTGAISSPFAITVDLPPVVAADSFTADEDVALTVAASGLLSNDSDPPTSGTAPPGRGLTTVVATAPLNGVLNLALDGSFSYTPNGGFNGVDTFTYRARDGRAGNETTGNATITVVSINDAPSFTAGATITVPEDAGAQSVPAWATSISAGPANESGQAVNFIAISDNLALFAIQPAVSPTGTLTFTSAPGASGVATITVRLHDNGGTANGGSDTSAPQVFTITVSSAADAPLAAADSFVTNEDTALGSGASSVLSNDSDQDPGTTLTAVLVSTTTNGTLSLNANGTFGYAPNPNFFGADTFTYRASDGGETLSNVATVTITVNAVNDVPSFTRGGNQAAPTGSLAQLVTGWATGISAGPANESSQTVSFILTNDNTALFDVQPAVAANGALSYTPRQNREGTANVTVSIQDNGGTANGGINTSAPQTFTITVSSTIQSYVVTNTNDSGNGSLRAAILNANLNASPDFIQFNLSGTARTINLLSPLPPIAFPVVINGSSQPGYAGTPIVELNGGAAGAGANGFTVTASNVTIRGLSIVGFAGNGITLQGGGQSVVESNRIGLRGGAAGTVLGNGASGVYVVNSSGNTVAYNAIGGNALAGVFLYGDADLNQFHHNLIGTNPAGTAAAANLRGVVLEGSTVATSSRPTGNVIDANQIAGNTNAAIDMSCGVFCGAEGTQITGNTIGLSTSGTVVANGTGIQVLNGNGTQISGNVIAGGAAGIVISEGAGVVAGSPIVIRSNKIGTDSTGAQARPNSVGIRVNGVTIPVLIGGTPAQGNLIAFNTGVGINVLGTGVSIGGNAIHGNTGLGIDLSGDGVTANDAGDGDTGPNLLQNYPMLTLAYGGGGAVTLTGSLNSLPNTTFTIEFFSNVAADPSGYGEGQQSIGTMTVTTDGLGNAPISTVLPAVASGSFITATATSPAGMTSEFSQARIVLANLPPTPTDDTITAYTGETSTTYAAANDTDPGVASPSVLVSIPAVAPGASRLILTNDVAVVNATGRAYFSANNLGAAFQGSFGILDTNTATFIGTVATPTQGAATLTRVNQATQIAYMRSGSTLMAIDGRSASPTFNQVILSLSLGTINSMAIDETRGRLYLTVTTTGGGTLTQGRIVAIDNDPSSATFHQVLTELPIPSSQLNFPQAGSIVVNPVTNKIYTSINVGPLAGVNVIDGATFSTSLIAATNGASTLAVNTANDMVYAVQGTNLFAIDGATNTRIATIALPANAAVGAIDNRLAIHRVTGRVFVRLGEFPSGPSRLVVVDGDRNSPTFNSILTTLPLGRENNNAMVAIDESANRLITTSSIDLEATIVDTTTNAVVGTVTTTQPTPRVTIDTVHHRAYLVNAVGYIQSVDLVTGTTHAIIPTGVEHTSMAVDTVNHSAYVTDTGVTTGLKRFNHTGVLSAPAPPHGDGRFLTLARNSVTNRVYALNTAADADGGDHAVPGFVSVIDGTSNTVIANVPVGPMPFQGIAVNEVTNRIYVGGGAVGAAINGTIPFPSGITVINGTDHTTVQADLSQLPQSSTIPGQVSFARDFVVNPVTNKVYVRVTGGSPATMAVLNGATNAVTALPNVFGNITIHRVNPVLNRVYIVGTDADGEPTMFVLDGNTDAVLTTVDAAAPGTFSAIQNHLAINRVTGRLYMVDFEDDQFGVFDGNTNTLMAVIPVGRGPTTVAVNETLNRIYVGNSYDRTLMIVDGATNRVVRTVSLPFMPYKIDVDESTSHVYILAAQNEAGVMVVSDPGTNAPIVTSVTQAAHGTVTLNADGSISYEAAAGYTGADSYTYTVADPQGGTATATVNVNVVASIAITTVSLPATTVGSSYAQTIATAGGTGPRTLSLASGLLPGGLALSSTGLITGVARQNGTFAFTVAARDSATPQQVTTRDFTIVVGPPIMTTLGLPNGFINTPYSQTVFVAGATGTITWSLDRNNNPLLNWLSLSANGVLSGTPPEFGTTPAFTVTATDSLSQSVSRQFTIFVNGPLNTAPLREGIVFEGHQLTLIGGNGTRSVTLIDGSLPPGLTLVSTGSFIGAPTRHGTYNFTLQLRDCELNNGLPSCTNQITQQIVNKNISMRVSAKDQQGSAQTQPAITFGGPAGRRLAQVVTVGSQGTLTGIGLQNITCPTATPVTVAIQRLTLSGLPDGTTIATGTAVTNYQAMAVAPPVEMAIDERFAFVVSSPVACTFTNAATIDQYQNGDAYVDAGGGWQTLFSADGRYDIPSFRTLIQPAMDVVYTLRGHGAHTTTLLNDGRVLIAGNNANAEVYDPATNLTTLTGTMAFGARTNHAAALLADGRVLITGGRVGTVRQASAEIFDPVTGQFTSVAAMGLAREWHQAVRLNDGRVLVVGGQYDSTPTSSLQTPTTEIFDPATLTFSPSGSMSVGREQFYAVLLQSGRVLVGGGYLTGSGASAETYDPTTGQFTATTGPVVLNSRGRATATRLGDGRVLIAGGNVNEPRATAELYDPSTNTFAATGSMAQPRYIHSAALLNDGSVLVAGGYDETSSNYIHPLATMERYLPGSGTWVSAGSMETVRQSFAAVTLPSGNVLLSGGFSLSWMTGNTAERYNPATALSLSPTFLADAPLNTPYPPVTFTGSGGGGGPYAIALASGTVPPGMAYVPATRTLSGTPTTTGIYTMGFLVTDGSGATLTQSLTVRVGAINTITTNYRLVDAAVGASYQVQLAANGALPITWSLAPSNANLPPGLSLSSGGQITGVPTTAAFYNFTVHARDNTGQTATKVLAINVRQPMSITTTSLPNVDLFSGMGCINTANHNGTRTFSIIAGAPPAGVTLSGSNNCFTGAVRETGTFTFTVHVTDQSAPPQTATQQYTISSWALDQDTGFGASEPELTFGGGTGRRLGQKVITGITGTLRGVRLNGLTCPTGAIVTAALQGMLPSGAPDGVTIVSGSAIWPSNRMVFSDGPLMAADAEFALVFDATHACAVRPNNFDGYTGTGFVSEGGGNWVTLPAFNGRYDVPFTTLVEPEPGLITLTQWRGTHTQTVLGSGLVLLTGGTGNTTAELLDLATSTSTAIPTPMTTSRTGHEATLLADGRVLLTGGYNSAGAYQSSAEIYNPVLNTFTAVGSMTAARAGHTATLLPNGQVLVTGGFNGTLNLSTAELFSPGPGTFLGLTSMMSARNEHTATLLPDGRVLLAGGFSGGASAELFDPNTMSFVLTDLPMSVPRGRHTATLLGNGTVLVTGGNGNAGVLHSSAEIFNPNSGPNLRGTFQPTVSGMLAQRSDHAAALLSDGTVLISGGLTDGNCCYPKPPTATMEIYDPALGFFGGAGPSLVSRYVHAASSLSGNRVLLSGTWGWSSAGGRLAEIIDVSARPRFDGASPGRASSTQAYSYTLFPEGGAGGPYVIAIVSGRLPAGITYDSGTRTFSGTPMESGTFSITVSLADAAGTTVFQTLTFRVDTLLIMTAQTLNTAFQGVPYVGVGLSAQGIGSVTWVVISGSLPPGLSLDAANGAITGTPTVSCCSYTFTVRATDSAGQTAVQTFTIPVQAPLNITTTSLPIWTASETPFGCVSVNGGSGSRTYSLSGSYPIGLSIQGNGCFDSTYPTRALRQGGTFTFTVHVSDSSVPIQTDSQEYTIRVHAQEQTSSWDMNASNVSIPDSRRLAQVFTSASVFPLSGVHVFDNLQCEPGVVVTAQAWRVTGSPARPDETVPLATGQTTAGSGNYVGLIVFPTPVVMPRGAQFAITLDTSSPCVMRRWPTYPSNKGGDAFVDDGSGWTLARTALGREDLPITSMVLPPPEQRFFSNWSGGAAVVTLNDGRVFVAGPDNRAEIYDPANGALTHVGNMSAARYQPTATLLPDNRVLIAGGYLSTPVSTALATTEIFDPSTGVFSAGPMMGEGRYDHTATTLLDGRVLITGGRAANSNSLNSAVLFAANGGSVIDLTMTGARAHHTATRLADGRVFILGGWTSAPFPSQQAEIFDPANNSFTSIAASMPYWPSDHTATLVVTGANAGRLLVTGSGPYPQLAPNTYFFDPGTSSFTAGPAMRVPRIDHAATLLSDGRIVFTGGVTDWPNWISTSTIEIYNPLSNQFSLAGEMVADMVTQTSVWTTVLGQERVVSGGGWGSSALASRSGDIFDPATGNNPLAISTISLPDGQVGQEYAGSGLFLLNAANCQPVCDWTLAWGSLPPGLFLGINGELVSNGGLPSAGVYSFVLRITDANRTATRAYTLVVNRLVITSSPVLPAGSVGLAYNHQLTHSGGGGTVTWSVSGPLPSGLSLSAAGLVSGTPTTAGVLSFQVTLTDESGQTATQFCTMTVNAGPP